MVRIDPSATLSITVTKGCAMNCPHCGGHYLKHMIYVDDMEKHVGKYSSFLISGGMLSDGRIPFEEYMLKLYALKQRYNLKYNFHIGFPENTPFEIESLADVVSFDVFGDSTVLESIYNISRTPQEIIETVMPLEVKKVPHITIGIMGGVITHEYKAIDMLSNYFDTVVLNVFIPTARTEFQGCTPPTIEEVEKVFRYASEKVENVVLGCMYPRGEYRKRLQEKIREYIGFLVKPVEKSNNLGDNTYDFYGCCAFRV